MHAIQKTMDGWMCIKKKSSREMNLFGYGEVHGGHWFRLGFTAGLCERIIGDYKKWILICAAIYTLLNVKARTSTANICNDVSPRRILHTQQREVLFCSLSLGCNGLFKIYTDGGRIRRSRL
jgi:hypothetical protein